MNANIVVKLNDGRSYVYGNVDTHREFTLGKATLEIGDLESVYQLHEIKEILIKPMPLMESIAHSVLGLHRHD